MGLTKAFGKHSGYKVHATPALNTVYIDPTNSTSGRDGSIENPYNSFVDITGGLVNNKVYKMKSGTELVTSTVIDMSNRANVIIESYSTGAKPKIKFTGSGTCAVRMGNCTNCTFSWIELYTDLFNSLITLIAGSTNTGFDGGSGNIIEYCSLHDVKQGATDGGMAIRRGGTNNKILNCEIYNCGADGIYEWECQGIEIGYCNVHHINQNYGGAPGFNTMGGSASGDSLQLGGNYNGFNIHHNIFDRSDNYTGNKYAVILSQLESQGLPAASGIIEYNEIKVTSSVLGGILIGFAENSIVRFNKFSGTSGVEGLLKLSGYKCINIAIYGNSFYDGGRGISLNYIYDSNLDYASFGGSVNSKIWNNVFHNLNDRAIYSDGCKDVEVKNNIFNNLLLTYSVCGVPTWDISNNCYNNITTIGTPGTGLNPVMSDPLFVDTSSSDFHLQSTSPCISAGIDVGLTEDYDGNPITGINVEIGIYEY